MNHNILQSNPASIRAVRSKGTYICRVKGANVEVSSNPIELEVNPPRLKKHLIERYCAQPETPEDSWPPQSGDTYINLALIKQGNIEKAGEYARNTVQGDMDDIMADKEGIEIVQKFQFDLPDKYDHNQYACHKQYNSNYPSSSSSN